MFGIRLNLLNDKGFIYLASTLFIGMSIFGGETNSRSRNSFWMASITKIRYGNDIEEFCADSEVIEKRVVGRHQPTSAR